MCAPSRLVRAVRSPVLFCCHRPASAISSPTCVIGQSSGLSRRIACAVSGAAASKQLEILAVAERVLQARPLRDPVAPSCSLSRNASGEIGTRSVKSTAPQPLAVGQPRGIERQAVADVDAGVQLVPLVQQ